MVARTLRVDAGPRVAALFTSWPFLAGLCVLLANDLALKNTYPGVVTGKLSDFAGIAVLALLFLTLFPQRRILVYAVLSTAFVWWKSPASAGFIAWVNGLGLATFGRTVDYGDLVALLVLPACSVVATAIDEYRLPWDRARRILAVPVAAATLCALLGTSVVARRQAYSIRDTSAARTLQREEVAAAIRVVAERHGLRCKDCARPTESAAYQRDDVAMTYVFEGPDVVRFSISAYPGRFFFFGSSGEKKADALRESLKAEFTRRFRNLEYVEALEPAR